jgi:hypothetical protein
LIKRLIYVRNIGIHCLPEVFLGLLCIWKEETDTRRQFVHEATCLIPSEGAVEVVIPCRLAGHMATMNDAIMTVRQKLNYSCSKISPSFVDRKGEGTPRKLATTVALRLPVPLVCPRPASGRPPSYSTCGKNPVLHRIRLCPLPFALSDFLSPFLSFCDAAQAVLRPETPH